MNDLALLAPQIGVSERTLRRALAEGSIHGERLSPRRLKLTATEKNYLVRQWPLLGQLRAALRTEPNVRFALLFGSAARGDDTSDSDVDLLVEMRDESLLRGADLALKLEGLLGKDVDVIALEEATSNPLLLADAARDGRVIVDRDERWPIFSGELAHFEKRAETEYQSRKRRALAGIERLLA